MGIVYLHVVLATNPATVATHVDWECDILLHSRSRSGIVMSETHNSVYNVHSSVFDQYDNK